MANDITSETIKTILDIQAPPTFMLTDAMCRTAPFAHRQMFEVKAAAPALSPQVEVSTLLGFADLISAHLDGEDFPAEWLIHVEDEATVHLLSRNSDRYGRRPVLIRATPVDFEQFRFGQWMLQEEFVIALSSKFAETEDRGTVLKLASSLTSEAITTSNDDGVTQVGTARVGLRLKEQVTLKSRVSLAPYRTFPELEQPASDFVFRARCNEGAPPTLMLVEADGGRWKLNAIATIKDALKAFNLGIPIIA